MKLDWNSPVIQRTIFRLCLITSTGPYGDNVMTSGMVTFVSFSPLTVAVSVWSDNATCSNIRKLRQFGVNVCPDDSPILASVSGTNSGKEYNKIAALKELGFTFVKGKLAKIPMLDGAVLGMECEVIESLKVGSHVLFVGNVLGVTSAFGKSPLLSSGNGFYRLGEQVQIPKQTLVKVEKALSRNRKKAGRPI